MVDHKSMLSITQTAVMQMHQDHDRNYASVDTQ